VQKKAAFKTATAATGAVSKKKPKIAKKSKKVKIAKKSKKVKKTFTVGGFHATTGAKALALQKKNGLLAFTTFVPVSQ